MCPSDTYFACDLSSYESLADLRMNLYVVKPRELPFLQPFYHLSRVRGVAYDTFSPFDPPIWI